MAQVRLDEDVPLERVAELVALLLSENVHFILEQQHYEDKTMWVFYDVYHEPAK